MNIPNQVKQKIIKKIESSKNIAVLISEPDGDSVGTGIALHEILKQKNKHSTLLSHFDLSDFQYLPGIREYEVTDITKQDLGQFNLIITLDTAEERRLLDKENAQRETFHLPEKSFVINIDHHPETSSQFGDINVVLHNVSSTAEIVYTIFKEWFSMTPTIATNILNGIIRDTVCFRQPDVSPPQAFRIAAELIEFGADHELIVYRGYYSLEKEELQANLDAMGTYQIRKAGKYTFVYAVADNAEGAFSSEDFFVTNETLRSIRGTDFFVRLTPHGKNITACSFRSRRVEVYKIAEFLGGGGHKKSAGATVEKNPVDTIAAIEQYLHSNKLKPIK